VNATGTASTRDHSAHTVRIAVLIGVVAVCWFTLLSGWLGVTPGTVLVTRQNVLFNSDTNIWIDEMVNGQEPPASWRVVHPLEVYLWRPPCQALSALLRAVLPRERAGVLAARLFVALVAGAGVGVLALVALRSGVEVVPCVLLFVMYLLFTSSSTIALPEHFGISNGLLSMAFGVPILLSPRRAKVAALAALALLCGGTTITNVLYPFAALYQFGIRAVRARRAILAAVPVVLGLALFLFVDSHKVVTPPVPGVVTPFGSGDALLPQYVPSATRWYAKSTTIHTHVLDYLNLRMLHDPRSAGEYAVYAVLAPVVGPIPSVRKTKGSDMVTYESGQPLHWSQFGFAGSDGLHLRDYVGMQVAGAVIWTGLFCYCLYHGFSDPRTRRLAWLPFGWVVFDILFHNVWGDELVLYAPHWSWALMALVVLGARRLRPTAAAALIVPLAICQISTLLHIRSALLTIVQ
jgi:hypothetical protein